MEYIIVWVCLVYLEYKYRWTAPLSRYFRHQRIKRKIEKQWAEDRAELRRQWAKERDNA